jgi:polyhydroxyalkanoate synthesis regulator protein
MIKKEESKNSPNKEKSSKRMTAQEREEILVENFTGLQHAMTNLSIKFSALSENINKLLQIFEEAAKKFSFPIEKPVNSESNKGLQNAMMDLSTKNKGLQNAMMDLSTKFGELSENINKLPQIFEEAVKKFSFPVERPVNSESNEDLIKKIDSLIDQNKTIAQGLVIMEEKIRTKPESSPRTESFPRRESFSYASNEMLHPRPKPLPNR